MWRKINDEVENRLEKWGRGGSGKGFLRKWYMRWIPEDKKKAHSWGKLCALLQRWVHFLTVTQIQGSFLLNSSLSSVKDQGSMTQNIHLDGWGTREDSEIGDTVWVMNMCREEKPKKGEPWPKRRTWERWQRKRENNEPNLGILHNFTYLDLRDQVLKSRPEISRKKNDQERRKHLKLVAKYLVMCVWTTYMCRSIDEFTWANLHEGAAWTEHA